MDTVEIMQIAQIVMAVLIAGVILLQQGGGGLGTMFGGGGGESYRSKRGAENFMYKFTIILVVLFVVNALAIAVLSSK